jgi:hypothetical protein
VSQVRVVTSVPKVFSISVMNTGPRGLGTYALKTSLPFAARMRAPSTSGGSESPPWCGWRRKVTTRLAFAGRRKAAYGSASSNSFSPAAERTMVPKARPRCFSIAASALRSIAPAAAARVLNTTLPLDSTVFTSVKPAASKQRFSSGIFAFIGLTPRRKAR